MRLTRRDYIFGAAALAAMATARETRADSGELIEISGPAFGADWRVRLAAEADSAAIAAAMVGVVGAVDAAMSPYRHDSEITRFNLTETADWLPLSGATLANLREARRIAALTGGAFDPTLGGLVGRYGFGPIHQPPEGSFAGLELSADAARKADPRQSLDLCGIAKGHALDRAVSTLAGLGQRDFLIEIGGEVAGLGAHPQGRPWKVGIEDPRPGRAGHLHVVELAGEALATSGDKINSYVAGGHRYGHIIDPARHRPAETALTSVSVFAPRGMTADALATALFALGAEAGPELAEAQGIPALFLARDGAGLAATFTGGFADRIIG
ncbi:FAD:protein FMN transferase [Frigidibacter sp. ROC022]|uniref:FAD:protein FMN transferase n=1 Tax=Frigidibacter sp. ROC022 TaxID=2971796 RepID=UPI00215A7C73|nr:FAD:protein FMN transferase [Frigidibacter sp. ROC022]MCR8725534.1 FAD:protein FMN transferase [Frigidibacter sp. ROC022]